MYYILKYKRNFEYYYIIEEKLNKFYQSHDSLSSIEKTCMAFEGDKFLTSHKSLQEHIDYRKTMEVISPSIIVYSGEELDIDKIKESIPEEFI